MKFKYAQEISNLPDGEHFDANTPGLSLIKRKTGKHSWTLLYRHNSPKLKRWTIGRLNRISLKEARKRVQKRSDDPVADKKKQRLEENNTPTFKQLCKRYIKEWCEKNQRYWKKSETALRHPRFDSWQRRPVIEIERSDVKKLIATIPGDGLANQVRAQLHALFNFALDEDLLLVNPVARTKRRFVLPRDRVLTDDEIRSAWKIPIFRDGSANVSKTRQRETDSSLRDQRKRVDHPRVEVQTQTCPRRSARSYRYRNSRRTAGER